MGRNEKFSIHAIDEQAEAYSCCGEFHKEAMLA